MQMLQPVSRTGLNYVASVSFSRRKMNQTIALILSIIKRAQIIEVDVNVDLFNYFAERETITIRISIAQLYMRI
jgi:hypothetical protein